MTHLIPGNHITLLQNGEAYFPAIISAFELAEHEIYLESYIFEDDATGQRVAEALKHAAKRGVKTHVLVDGFGSKNLPQSMIDSMSDAGVRVLKFRPKISPWTFRRQRLRRLHRKIVVVDQEIAFVGGINIIDDMDTPGHTPPRYDYAVAVEGPLVGIIHAAVRHVWSLVSWTHLHQGWLRDRGVPVSSVAKGTMRAAFLVRDNLRHRRDIEEAYLSAIEKAQTEIIIANAYFLPGISFRHALTEAAARGVRVILLLQGRVEYLLLHYASRALYGNFLEAGIEIYEYHKSFMHAKVAVIDGHWATVGSSNIDPFSLLLSREANVVVENKEFAGALRQNLLQSMETGSRPVLKISWKRQFMLTRLVSWLSYGLVRFMMGVAGYAREKNNEKI
ncbi:cardiolipin synthase ClsB [Sulfurirhabdus autotrophica]|uniref:Cardiolipin synthase B n=1 Tax=Sulfurirhabdus autotrophica TaxID=1706046 RepID=A0A4V2W1E2_9PROT|nr:cardiolipin synthase ClsB [Sulfurirhabdus autotrophica]TCV83789.1 cardiolipin synthase [Sulfurirhabdus autotrophica]